MMIRYKRTDLPLEKDTVARFLPWLIALMVFLSVIAGGVLATLDTLIERWDTGVGHTMTIQLPENNNKKNNAVELQEVLSVLASNKKIKRYEVISDQRTKELLAPWLGNIEKLDILPIPSLIDIEIIPGANLQAEDLQAAIRNKVPKVVVDDHRVWLLRLIKLIRTIELVTFITLGFILLALVGTIIFVTRTSLEVHRDVIEVLHLIGAQDTYIAKQFAGRAMVMAFRGAVLGIILGTPALLTIGYFLAKMQTIVFIEPGLNVIYVILGISLPILVGLIAQMTAKITVLKLLSRFL